MSVECQVNIKSQSELDIGGRENCLGLGLASGSPAKYTIGLGFTCNH